jgi:ferredoxin
MNTLATPLFHHGLVEAFDQPFDAWVDRPLLQSMESGGINWPSSCRNGTCRTCIGQLVSGSVRYEVEWPGYVLPCVAHPCSDVVLREGY